MMYIVYIFFLSIISYLILFGLFRVIDFITPYLRHGRIVQFALTLWTIGFYSVIAFIVPSVFRYLFNLVADHKVRQHDTVITTASLVFFGHILIHATPNFSSSIISFNL